MNKLKIPLGIENFMDMRTRGYYYIAFYKKKCRVKIKRVQGA